LHRAIGVMFQPEHERQRNYVPTEMTKRYDAFIFLPETRVLKSLHASD